MVCKALSFLLSVLQIIHYYFSLQTYSSICKKQCIFPQGPHLRIVKQKQNHIILELHNNFSTTTKQPFLLAIQQMLSSSKISFYNVTSSSFRDFFTSQVADTLQAISRWPYELPPPLTRYNTWKRNKVLRETLERLNIKREIQQVFCFPQQT